MFSFVGFAVSPVSAQPLAPQDRLCDPTYEDCRAEILTYIAQETVAIDMGFWLMTDARYANELVKAFNRGVKIRLLMDPRCGAAHSPCVTQNEQLAAAGLPMRNRQTSGILHWKVVIFAGQGQVQFAGANYAPFEMSPEIPYINYTDEIVYFTNTPSLVQSFMRKFDDLWTSPTEFANYANITAPLVRSYPTYPIDPELNFPPDDSYRARALQSYAGEQQSIDVLMFRITDEAHTNGMIAAVNRNVPVRLITDDGEYRNPKRLWDAYNVDKMYAAGVQVRLDGHLGINHEKAILLRGSGMTIFGSSNWTSPSSDSQREHNMFTTKQWIYDWVEAQFQRKWSNGAGYSETKPFIPLPPDAPIYSLPANNITGVATTGTSLAFWGGLWAHNYDIYFGTTPNPPLLEANRRLGPSQSDTDYRYYPLPALLPGTTYYWKIVSKTMAFVSAEGPVSSFRTAGTAPNNVPPSVNLTSPSAGATFGAPANITLTANATDSDGTISSVSFYAGNTLIGTDSTAPFSLGWNNVAEGTYAVTAVATDSGNASTTSAAVSLGVTAPATTAPPQTLPGGWTQAGVGNTGVAGSASFSNGTYTVAGAGADVWGTADAFHWTYRSLDGDGSIVARVTSIQNVNVWSKAGVMIRNSLSPSSAQGFMLVAASATKGVPFQRRVVDGGTTVSSPGSQSTAPRWVKLVRAGNLVTGYESADGLTWTTVGSDTFTLGTTALVGLAVSSKVAGTNATATFDNVTVTAATPQANVAPTVAITAPGSGTTLTAPATLTLSATASDSDGTVAKVDFYSGSQLLGTVMAAPYTLTVSGLSAGTYNLTAVATDNTGATTTSSMVSVTVAAATPQPNVAPTVAITAPGSGTTLTAPATLNLSATASDSDGTVAKVDFYSGSQLLGTVMAAPYTLSVGGLSAGTYNLTAVATDNTGGTATSSMVSVTVAAAAPPPPPPPAGLPVGWGHADLGAVPLAGDATSANGVFTVKGSGADVWGTADAFHFAYTTMSGNGTIVARVTSIPTNVNNWVKAGVMIRESLTANSAHGFMLASASKGLAFQRRPAAGGTSVSSSGSLSAAPRWVKMQRIGDVFTAYESADGLNWTLVGTETIPMGTTVYVGLAVTSHTTTASVTCTFDSISIQ